MQVFTLIMMMVAHWHGAMSDTILRYAATARKASSHSQRSLVHTEPPHVFAVCHAVTIGCHKSKLAMCVQGMMVQSRLSRCSTAQWLPMMVLMTIRDPNEVQPQEAQYFFHAAAAGPSCQVG